MMTYYKAPPQPPHSYRITLTLNAPVKRLDTILLNALRDQNDNASLKSLTRKQFKDLFASKRVLIKGQPAKPSSSLAKGETCIDIL